MIRCGRRAARATPRGPVADGTVAAIAGRGFARGAKVYAASRPGYPPAALDWLRDRLGIGPGSAVAEIGAGTGKFTRLIVETGADVVAVDPVTEMLEQLHRDLPMVRTAVAPAAALPFADASLDAIVCATAFHWFAQAEVVAEFRRVLRPDGALGLIWNVRDISIGWAARLSALIALYQGAAPRETDGAWRKVFPAPGFTPLQETRMHFDHRGPPEEVIVGRTLSTSFVAALPNDQRAALIAQVRALIAETPELAGQAEVTYRYVTAAHDCRRQD